MVAELLWVAALRWSRPVLLNSKVVAVLVEQGLRLRQIVVTIGGASLLVLLFLLGHLLSLFIITAVTLLVIEDFLVCGHALLAKILCSESRGFI